MKLDTDKTIRAAAFSKTIENWLPSPNALDLECLKCQLPECVGIDNLLCPVAKIHPLSQAKYRSWRKHGV